VVAIAFAAATAIRIVRDGTGDGFQRADTIIVFGAAEYAGRPSPVYRARLDHAYELFRRGAAPVIITTGYLNRRGIPDSHLIAETQGADTAQSAQRVAVIMRANRMRTALAVSDAYHMFRIKRLMEREGMVAYGSPRPASWPRSLRGRISVVLRELASYTLWWMHLK
jgi:uncharacterized SAM-binding protein YcdF (DUF218 family)